jgi:hypothetical protein
MDEFLLCGERATPVVFALARCGAGASVAALPAAPYPARAERDYVTFGSLFVIWSQIRIGMPRNAV